MVGSAVAGVVALVALDLPKFLDQADWRPHGPTEWQPESVVNEIAVIYVEPGDTLSEIAARFGVTVEELQRWNGIGDPDLVYVGQQIVLYSPANLLESGVASSAYTSAPANNPQSSSSNGWIGGLLLVVLLLFILRQFRGGPILHIRNRFTLGSQTVPRFPPRKLSVRPPFRPLRVLGQNDGERRVRSTLKRLYRDWSLLNDVLLPSGRGTAQIDHILLSPAGLFLIETKNLNGWIFGSPSRKQWTQSFAAGRSARRLGVRSRQFKFYNPLFQNEGHANALTNLGIADWRWLRPVTVFVGNAVLKTTDQFLPFEAHECEASRSRHWRMRGVICSSMAELHRYIAFCMDVPSNPRLTPEDLDGISSEIQAVRIPVTAETRAQHNAYVRSAQESTLR